MSHDVARPHGRLYGDPRQGWPENGSKESLGERAMARGYRHAVAPDSQPLLDGAERARELTGMQRLSTRHTDDIEPLLTTVP